MIHLFTKFIANYFVVAVLVFMGILWLEYWLSSKKQAILGLVMPLLLLVPIIYYSHKFIFLYHNAAEMIKSAEGYGIALGNQHSFLGITIFSFIILLFEFVVCKIIQYRHTKLSV
jgi:hypothetical protein